VAPEVWWRIRIGVVGTQREERRGSDWSWMERVLFRVFLGPLETNGSWVYLLELGHLRVSPLKIDL